MAIVILRSAFNETLRNWRMVLRIFVLPIILFFGLTIAMVFALSQAMLASQSGPGPLLSLLSSLLGPILMLLLFWPVVAWHRFLLIDEVPRGFVPKMKFRSVLRYIFNLFGLSILILFAVTPLMVLLSFPAFLLLENGTSLGSRDVSPEAPFIGSVLFVLVPTLLFQALIFVPYGYLLLRCGMILPGAAVGNHIGLRGSWRQTAKLRGSIFAIVCLGMALMVLAFLAILLLQMTGPSQFGVALVLMLAMVLVQVFLPVYGLTILSMLYRRCVEENPQD